MSEQAKRLAQRLEQANRQLIALIEACSADDWRKFVEKEGRTVGVVAHHVGAAYLVETELIEGLARGTNIPALNWHTIDEMNANHAQQHARPTREETVELLRRNSQIAIRCIRDLDDAQLQRRSRLPFMGDEPVSTQELIEQAVIGHVHGHRRAIETVMDRPLPVKS